VALCLCLKVTLRMNSPNRSKHCRFLINDCRLVSSPLNSLSSIGNQQSTNWPAKASSVALGYGAPSEQNQNVL